MIEDTVLGKRDFLGKIDRKLSYEKIVLIKNGLIKKPSQKILQKSSKKIIFIKKILIFI